MNRHNSWTALPVALLAFAGSALAAAPEGKTDEGTRLTGSATASAPVCRPDGRATVTISGRVQTTGSVDSAKMTVSVDRAAATDAGTIRPQDFAHDGRNKSAPFSIPLTLTEGAHEIVVCFIQSGAQGRTPKQTCLTPVAVNVSCKEAAQPASCGPAAFYGDVLGNPSLCRGSGPPHIPVHVKGELGDAAKLKITGPAGFVLEVPLRRAGDSCNYHFNWDTQRNGGAGAYTFTATGNGQQATHTAQLQCPSEGGGKGKR